MSWYRKHGHEPTDAEIALHGFKAFGPARPEYVPTKDDFARAHTQLATGDPGELKELAEELADLWPGWGGCWPGYFYGYNAALDDD